MRYIGLAEVLSLHQQILANTGGAEGVRDLGALESALSQPKLSAGGMEAYPTLIEKAAALCFSLSGNHPFVDGNKRVAHAAMEVFLLLNGWELVATVDDQEALMLRLASGEVERDELLTWLQEKAKEIKGSGS